MGNIKDRTSLPVKERLMMAFFGEDWKKTSAESSAMPPPAPPDDPVARGTEVNRTAEDAELSKALCSEGLELVRK